MPDIKTGIIHITGLSDLEKRLLDFPDKLAKNILSGAIRGGAAVIRNEAKALAPMSNGGPHQLGKGSKAVTIQPGHLKKNIKVRLAPRKKRDVPITFWVYVSAKAWYWKFVEFGRSYSKAGFKQKQFMRPAFDTRKEQATEAIRDYLSTRIDKEAAKR